MSYLNKWLGMGNLIADPQREGEGAGVTASFVMAINEPWGKEGDRATATTYVRVTAKGKLGEAVLTNLTKSRQVLVEGKLRTQPIEGTDRKHYAASIWADNIQFLGSNAPNPEGAAHDQTR
jgi:single-strand DNA-binding protein